MSAAPPTDVSHKEQFLALFVTCIVIEPLFVLSRLYVRTFVRQILGWDDYLIIFALV